MFLKFIIFTTFCSFTYSLPDLARLIRKNGYPAETHTATTEDGYIVTMHRIPHGKNSTVSGSPVLLTHGLGASSADYVNSGPGKGLGYVLADAGYDVWMGNARGNSYSMKHVSLDPKKDAQQFYNFSWHEIGYYDFPAQIDHILNKTSQESLYYIGHSQGGTAYFVLTSQRTEYNKKIKLASLLASSGIMQHENIMLEFISYFIEPLETLGNSLRIYSLPYPELLRFFLSEFCMVQEDICFFVYNMIVGYDDSAQFNMTMLPGIFKTTPSAFPLKSLYHYGQLIKSGEFKQYDFGSEENMIQYGSEKPPVYDFANITAPTAFYYGKNDMIIGTKDIDTMSSLIPNLAGKFMVKWDKWNHMDFLYAIDVVELLYNDLINLMKKY